jgi:hypothetical protein
LRFKFRVFIDRYGDIPYVKAVGGDVVKRRFHLLLDGFLEAPNILAAINFDRKYASRSSPRTQQLRLSGVAMDEAEHKVREVLDDRDKIVFTCSSRDGDENIM